MMMERALLEDIRFVSLGIADVHGAFRAKTLTRSGFAAVVDQGAMELTDLVLALDPVDAPITAIRDLGVAAGAPNLEIEPDLSTLTPLTYRPGWSLCLGSARGRDGKPCDIESRTILSRVLEDAAGEGLRVEASFEYELRLAGLDGGYATGPFSYVPREVHRLDVFIEEVEHLCQAIGADLSAVHSEPAPGLIEANLMHREGMEAADKALLFRTSLKLLAHAHGLSVSFMAKPVVAEEGCSGHIHLSLWDRDENVLARTGKGSPSELEGAIAGLLQHMPGLSLVYNPTINSYKRLVPGYFAPVNASWGFDNRTAAVRVLTPSPERTRIEVRRPGADANPYLVLAATVGSAVAGIRTGAHPPEPVFDDASHHSTEEMSPLPTSLEGALAAFRSDNAITKMLGEAFCAYYATTREWELEAWRRAVSDWEQARYEHLG